MDASRNGLRLIFSISIFFGLAQFASAQTVCRVHSLAEVGDDPSLGAWIASTIPQMIEPASWKAGTLSYHAPTRVLIVNQTPAVHAKIADFIDGIKKANQPTIVPVHAEVAAPAKTNSATSPKHLFHFIIRYEGNGTIDPSVFKNATKGLFLNTYSTDPMIRMEQKMIDSENLRQMHNEWRQFWMNEQPSQLTPYRIHGGVGPASSSLYPPMPLAGDR
ncbi:MAG: hypothetical protein FJ303_12045 [Planctomycetes bacterium]|nr:hypothetical protein [Planctomycetota bacterium]